MMNDVLLLIILKRVGCRGKKIDLTLLEFLRFLKRVKSCSALNNQSSTTQSGKKKLNLLEFLTILKGVNDVQCVGSFY